jgi:penicillin-binding protein 1A
MPLQFPSIRRYLIGLNLEISSLYDSYYPWMDDLPLSEFEAFVLILEDRRFLVHRGIDLRSVAREVIKFALLKRHGGASTIEMQYIRTVNQRKERRVSRKLREMLLAWLAQYHFEKRALLRSYLDIAFFGSGLYGADAAAAKAFGKSVSELSSKEAAELAAMLVYPMPISPTEKWIQRIGRRSSYALRIAARLEKSFNQIRNGKSVRIR